MLTILELVGVTTPHKVWGLGSMARSGWPDLVFADGARRETLSRAVAAGRLRRIARGIYTPSPDPIEVVTALHLRQIVAHEFPGAVFVDRSARTALPDGSGNLYLDHRRDRPLALPGVVVRPRPGPGPLPGDAAQFEGLHLSSPARGLIDNLAGRGPRFLSTADVERWVIDLRDQQGEKGLREIRDLAREVARLTDRMPVFDRLARIIAAAVPALATTTGSGRIPVMDPGVAGGSGGVRARVPVMDSNVVAGKRVGKAAAGAGAAHDAERISKFEALADFLAHRPTPTAYPDPPDSGKGWLLLPFYEAYFSNCIEGAPFTLDRAAAVVFDKMVPMESPASARELLGTYRLVSKPAEMSLVPGSAQEFLELLRRRHHAIVLGRPAKSAGQFRRATPTDSSAFVSPELVEGTLRAGFDIGRALRDPLNRAVFMMFLVSEVHPFTAGSGCLARVMMNAELVAADEVRIAIPAILRGEYLTGRSTASRQRSFQPLCSVLDRARRWTSEVDFSSWATARRDAARTNALADSIRSEGTGIRLLLPSALEPVAG